MLGIAGKPFYCSAPPLQHRSILTGNAHFSKMELLQMIVALWDSVLLL
jgi:hypothetical protein